MDIQVKSSCSSFSTDVFVEAELGNCSFSGFVDDSIRFIEKVQLLDAELWSRFVNLFRTNADDCDNGWRGEFWGKMMRGAAFVYSYTKNSKLYDVMNKTVEDLLATSDECGRISTYSKDKEFDGWDLWSRKYVLLGMQYFYEVCDSGEQKQRILASMKAQLDYIISKIGKREEGKKPINSASRHWRGLNSSSILEPVVRMYNLTGEERYFDFATYIVNEGGMDIVNVFELAYENKLYPYQYPITKAYEMTSCFEGLLEYYRITGNERYKTSIINYADRILESDFTIIGCCGCTSEYFDHSSVRQANTNNYKIMQETCVTVTMMKFFYQLTRLTGDSKYADAFETSLYNAFLGAVNTEGSLDSAAKSEYKEEYPDLIVKPMPFDSYNILTAGARGISVGGMKVMSDNHYYGCCACIGSAGHGLIPKMALLPSENGFALNLYINGKINAKTNSGNSVVLDVQTQYPNHGDVKITVTPDREEYFDILLRNPAWSKTTCIYVNGEKQTTNDGYIILGRTWKPNDVIDISFDMRTEAIYPIPYGSQVLMNVPIWGHNYVIPSYDEEDPMAKHHIALRRGPVILAQEDRLGYSLDTPVSIEVNNDGYVDVEIPERDIAPYEHIVEVSVPLKNGKKMTVTDYASAGKLWSDEGRVAAWMLTE